MVDSYQNIGLLLAVACSWNLRLVISELLKQLSSYEIRCPLPAIISLITPDYFAIRVYYFNRKVLARYLIRLDDGMIYRSIFNAEP